MIGSEGLVAAVDQGTTTTRCIVFDSHGQMVSIARRENRQGHPRPGWVEHDAKQIWCLTREVVAEAIGEAVQEVGPDSVLGIGVTNQRETTVIWDRRTGEPVHPAIVWQDNRTADVLEDVVAEVGEATIRERTGLQPATYFSGPKVRWILQEHPDLRDGLAAGHLLFGTIDSWLVWNFTGGVAGGLHLTDPTNASRTMMMDIDTLAWDPHLVDVMGLPMSAMPQIRPTIGSGAIMVDPVPGITIGAMIGDQQASLFGQTGLEAGEAKCTFGTGGFMLLNTGTKAVRSSHGLLTTVAYQIGSDAPVYALEGGIAMAGGLVQWIKDQLAMIRTPAEIETLAQTVDDNGGVYFVPAYSGLLAPYWDANAQGIIVGISGYTTRGHLARAVLESTAWQTKDLLDAMSADSGVDPHVMVVDGGMTSNNLLMQMVADALQLPVVRPKTAETVGLGAAYAAGLGVGLWPDQTVLRENWQRAGQWRPEAGGPERDAAHRKWQLAIELSRTWGNRLAHPHG